MTIDCQDVPERVYEVDVLVIVMFSKVNVTVNVHGPNPHIELVTTVVIRGPVVVGPCIGFTAGAFAGIRIPSAARVTQTIIRALTTSCLFKSLPSRCWV